MTRLEKLRTLNKHEVAKIVYDSNICKDEYCDKNNCRAVNKPYIRPSDCVVCICAWLNEEVPE